MTLDSVHPLFRGLAPRATIVVCKDPRVEHPEGHAAEEALISRAIPKRKNEFRAGRACAHEGMSALGIAFEPLVSGIDREPVWPNGIVGSISHSNVLCVAAVAHAREVFAIGIDTELDEPLPAALIPKVCTENEARRGYHKQVFSAKEATYKCLHPVVKTFFGFHAAEVEFSDTEFEVTLLMDLPPYKRGATFRGRHRTEAGLIATMLSVSA